MNKALKKIFSSEAEMEKLYDSLTISDILKVVATRVWERIGFVRSKRGLKIYETTITQNLLFSMMDFSEVFGYRIKLFEAVSEKTNGNDIECFIEFKEGYVLFPIQAKIIYSNNKYKQIKHCVKGSGEEQIDLLIEYAKKNKGFPLYIFYNHVNNVKLFGPFPESDKNQIETFGISFTSAYYLYKKYYLKDIEGTRKWQIPSFNDLHPIHARPIHEITSLIGDKKFETKIEREISKKMNRNSKEIKYYNQKELLQNPDWSDLTPFHAIGRTSLDRDVDKILGSSKDRKETFNPKFRIMISINDIKTQIGLLT